MATLHTVNKSPFHRDSLASCLRFVQPQDAILLIEDGIYAAIAGTAVSHLLEELQNVPVFVLAPDLQARGILSTRLIPGIREVDYGGFVDLVAEYRLTQAWL
jgi:tRNA 2-thiouridine synthesizing protein B